MQFTTHTGEVVTGQRLQDAYNKVADWYVQLAHDIRRENAYASHVSEETKLLIFADDLRFAEKIRSGKAMGTTVAQRINLELTGQSVALLP